MTITLLSLTFIKINWPISLLFSLLLGYGLGGGLYQTPCYLNMTQQFPANQQAFISALTRMIQNLAIAFEAAGAAMLIGLKTQVAPNALLHGIGHGWWLATSICILAWVVLFIFYRKNNATRR